MSQTLHKIVWVFKFYGRSEGQLHYRLMCHGEWWIHKKLRLKHLQIVHELEQAIARGKLCFQKKFSLWVSDYCSTSPCTHYNIIIYYVNISTQEMMNIIFKQYCTLFSESSWRCDAQPRWQTYGMVGIINQYLSFDPHPTFCSIKFCSRPYGVYLIPSCSGFNEECSNFENNYGNGTLIKFSDWYNTAIMNCLVKIN